LSAIREDTILNDWNPSESTLRRWAFDENLFLSEQDEDLVLHRREYLPILIPLADDPSCPKASYILACLDFYLMFLVLRGNDKHLDEVREGAALAELARHESLHRWAALQRRRLQYRAGIGPVNREQALVMGEELLNGICRLAQISVIEESASSWTVQLSVPPIHRHKEKLVIDKATGRFVFSR
jgi:hypothetical protein